MISQAHFVNVLYILGLREEGRVQCWGHERSGRRTNAMILEQTGGGKKETCRESRGRVVIPELESCLPVQDVLSENSALLSGDFNPQ